LICLGIEGTAHTLGIGIVSEDGTVLANVREVFVPETGGIHPREAAEFHAKKISNLLARALKQSGQDLKNVGLIAFSQGPGLPPCLRGTAVLARSLALDLRLPLIGVNHCLAHVEIGRLVSGAKDPITLYVSGGNTLVAGHAEGRYRIFGETLDIPIGNMLDVFARKVGFGHPGGPKIEKLAAKSSTYLHLPYVVKGMDLSYSGLLTAAVNKFNGENLESLCFSLQEVAFSMLAEVTERALAHTEKKSILLTGGVAANHRLQEMLESIANDHGVSLHVVSRKLAGDNGAMIAWTGLRLFQHGITTPIEHSHVDSKWRLDDVEIPWRINEGESE